MPFPGRTVVLPQSAYILLPTPLAPVVNDDEQRGDEYNKAGQS
jgi:hypothetical protein